MSEQVQMGFGEFVLQVAEMLAQAAKESEQTAIYQVVEMQLAGQEPRKLAVAVFTGGAAAAIEGMLMAKRTAQAAEEPSELEALPTVSEKVQ